MSDETGVIARIFCVSPHCLTNLNLLLDSWQVSLAGDDTTTNVSKMSKNKDVWSNISLLICLAYYLYQKGYSLPICWLVRRIMQPLLDRSQEHLVGGPGTDQGSTHEI